jgi:hypothetical protein
MRKCICGADMEYVGSMGDDGRYWCPNCGTYSQSYMLEETVWKTPKILDKIKQIKEVLE